MNNVISLAEYKLKKGIVPPNSPYYTSNASPEQINEAVERAKIEFSKPVDYRGKPPYAVVIGYKDQKGCVRLLKGQIVFSSKRSFEEMGGMATMKTIAVVQENGL